MTAGNVPACPDIKTHKSEGKIIFDKKQIKILEFVHENNSDDHNHHFDHKSSGVQPKFLRFLYKTYLSPYSECDKPGYRYASV